MKLYTHTIAQLKTEWQFWYVIENNNSILEHEIDLSTLTLLVDERKKITIDGFYFC